MGVNRELLVLCEVSVKNKKFKIWTPVLWFRGFSQLVLLWCLLLLWLHLQQEPTAESATLTRFWSKILSPVIRHNNFPSCSSIASCCDLVEAPNVKPGQILDSSLQGRARMLQEAPFGSQQEVWFLKSVLNWFHSMVDYCFPGKKDRHNHNISHLRILKSSFSRNSHYL